MRVVIADDEALLRDGLSRLLEEHGIDVVGAAGNSLDLLRWVELRRPDVALVDIRMPPTRTDEGLKAADEIRRRFPEVGVLLLSHHLESRYAMRLLEDHPERAGYLLKERVSNVGVLTDALARIVEGECVLDPTIVTRLLRRRRPAGPLDELTARERQVLELLAEGRSNQGVAAALGVSGKTVETYVGQIFSKLGIDEARDYHRRVLAVLAYLREE